MQFGYTLGREECRQASLAFRRLVPAWRWTRRARTVSVALAIVTALGAVVCGLVWSWTAAACLVSLAVWAAGVRVLLSDRFHATPPRGPMVIDLTLGDAGLAVWIDGQAHDVAWSRVTRLVDAGWALLVGIDDEEWLVVPVTAMGSREAVVRELGLRSGRPIARLR